MDMKRRSFLGILAAGVVVAAVDPKLLGGETEYRYKVSAYSGYDSFKDFQWLRVSVVMPDGREWHHMTHMPGSPNEAKDDLIILATARLASEALVSRGYQPISGGQIRAAIERRV